MQSVGMADRLSDHIDSKKSWESVDLLHNCILFPILISFAIRSSHVIIIIIIKKRLAVQGWESN